MRSSAQKSKRKKLTIFLDITSKLVYISTALNEMFSAGGKMKRTTTLRVCFDSWEKLRTLSFLENVSMCKIIKDLVDLRYNSFIKEHPRKAEFLRQAQNASE